MQIAVGNLPFLGKVKEFPFSAAFRASVIMAVECFPATVLFYLFSKAFN